MGLDLEEIWLPIFGYENRYKVSNLGQIKSLNTNKILRGESTKDGYIRVRLWNGKKYTSKMVHCLVAEAFIPLPDTINQYEVDHIDNNVTHNSVDNLQWLTHKKNLDKSFDLNHQQKPKKPVYQYTLQGLLIKKYESVNEAFRQTKIRHISECATGKRNTAGGYIWSYNLTINKKEGDDLSD